MRPRTALGLAALGALGAASGCGSDREGAPLTMTAWLPGDGAVALEPAAALDPGGRLWTTAVVWQEAARTAGLRVTAVDEGLAVRVAADEPASPHIATLDRGAYVVWEGTSQGGRALFGAECLEGSAGAPVRITAPGTSGLAPRIARTSPGRLELVFQAPRGASYDLMHAVREGAGWSEPTALVATPADEWQPRSAPDGRGGMVVVWDAFDGESFDVHLAWTRDGQVEEVVVVAGGPAYQGLPDVAVDPDGDAWVTWEVAPSFGAGDALRARRQVRLARVRRGGPVERAALDGALGPRAGLPRVTWAGAGPVVLARVPDEPHVPENPRNAPFFTTFLTRAVRFRADGAPTVTDIPDAEGGNAATESPLAHDGTLRCVFASDARRAHYGPKNAYDAPLEERWRLGVTTLPASDGLPALGVPRDETAGPGAASPRPVPGGPPALLGDLHRHTNQSRCQGRDDGLRLDVWRYARGPGGLDFVAITDHVQHLRPWSWWQTMRDTERYHDPPRLVTLFGVERNVKDEGHQNLVFRDRAAAAAGIASAPAQLDPELVVAIPHMTSARDNPFDWARIDPTRHRLVEVHQGNRGSYEGPGRPLTASGAGAPGAGLLAGLAGGLFVGLVGSSDHASSARSFAGAVTEDRSRPGVFAALRARRTYATTLPVRLDATLGTLRLGEEGALAAGASIDVGVPGSGPRLLGLELVRNGVRVGQWPVGRDGPTSWLLTLDPRHGAPAGGLTVTWDRREGARPSARPAPGDEDRVRVTEETNAFLIEVGEEPGRVLIESGDASGLRFELGQSAQDVAEDCPPGEEIALDQLAPPGLARLWNLGHDALTATHDLPVPDLSGGDTLMLRLTFEGGGMAWLSPFRITEVR